MVVVHDQVVRLVGYRADFAVSDEIANRTLDADFGPCTAPSSSDAPGQRDSDEPTADTEPATR